MCISDRLAQRAFVWYIVSRILQYHRGDFLRLGVWLINVQTRSIAKLDCFCKAAFVHIYPWPSDYPESFLLEA